MEIMVSIVPQIKGFLSNELSALINIQETEGKYLHGHGKLISTNLPA
jgi:hypothetical protein